MTFIASVIAKKGVAMIADSLATFSRKVVTYDQFMDYLNRKQKTANSNDIRISKSEIIPLFEKMPSHTTDYAEKLFQYDKFTAITLAGASQMGDKPIESLIQELAAMNAQDEDYYSKPLVNRVRDFCKFMDHKVRACIAMKGYVGRSILLFTHYDLVIGKTLIYRIVIDKIVKQSVEDGEWKYVSFERISEKRYVISEGQNFISKRILGEDRDHSSNLIPYVINKLSKDFNLPPESISLDYVQKLNDEVHLSREESSLIVQATFSNLSLQQAVDVAYVFLKMEIIFQASAAKIPTIGGLIKIAVIDKEGFRFITGNNILKPY